MEALHWFLDPIKNHYADFDGRASREQFWMFYLFLVIANIILIMVGNGWLMILFTLGIFLPNLAISVRRLHDIGKSGWWLLISIIPLLGIIILLVLSAQAGQVGNNQYGPDPLDPVEPEPMPMPTPAVITEAEPGQSQGGGQG